MGQEIEVRPGIVSRDSEGRSTCMPIYSRIVSLFAEQNELQYAVPGGLIGVGTTVHGPSCQLDGHCWAGCLRPRWGDWGTWAPFASCYPASVFLAQASCG